MCENLTRSDRSNRPALPVKHYSPGMYARLGFAVAAHLEPEILVVDEVLAVPSSIGNREANWYGRAMPLGHYRASCEIPAPFFNQGTFLIDLIMYRKGFTDAVTVPQALMFEIQDGSGMRGDFLGEFGGWARPAFRWTTVRVDR